MYTPKHTQLADGLQLITIPMAGVQSVTALILVNVGSRYEPLEVAGIAHFFEHIVFKGTTTYPSALELSSVIDAIGAEFNAFTSKEYTGFYVKAASRHLSTALDVLSDMMLRPLIPQDDIERESKVIIEEINMYKDNPMSHVSTIFDKLFFADERLSHDIIGSKETVSKIQKHDFEDFLSKWYGLRNMVLVLAGDAEVLGLAETRDLVEQSFSKQTLVTRTAVTPERHYQHPTNLIGSGCREVVEKTTEQAHFVIGWQGYERSSKLKPVISVLSVILGGNMSSRLFTEVREKRGLCYYVHSDVDYYHDTGIIGASAGVDPARAHEAVRVVLEECRAVATGEKPITENELAKAKEYIAGSLLLSLEDSKDVAQYFGSKKLLLDVLETPEEALARIQVVSAEEITQLARKVFIEQKPRLAIIGPFADASVFDDLN